MDILSIENNMKFNGPWKLKLIQTHLISKTIFQVEF